MTFWLARRTRTVRLMGPARQAGHAGNRRRRGLRGRQANQAGILDGMGEPDAWDPGSPRNRDRTRESWRQVRGLLMEWDLIGVASRQ
jgi:hypothetical protein